MTLPITRRTVTTGLTGLAVLSIGSAMSASRAPAASFALDQTPRPVCSVPEALLTETMRHDLWLFYNGLDEFTWAHTLVFFEDGVSPDRKVYPSPDCEKLRTLWNALDYFFKQNERVLLRPPGNEHDLAVQFWIMDQFFTPTHLPDTSWMMIFFPEYLEQMELVGRPYGHAPNPVWTETYDDFKKAPDNLYQAVRARWYGEPCSLPI